MMYLISVLTIFLTMILVMTFVKADADAENIRFLNSFGWEVEDGAVESCEFIIPDPFDIVYENYNKIQMRAGCDLRDYMGMKGVRYTYIVTNYPKVVGEIVRANVLCINNKAVGGDIMTVSIDGFMHSLLYSDSYR